MHWNTEMYIVDIMKVFTERLQQFILKNVVNIFLFSFSPGFWQISLIYGVLMEILIWFKIPSVKTF